MKYVVQLRNICVCLDNNYQHGITITQEKKSGNPSQIPRTFAEFLYIFYCSQYDMENLIQSVLTRRQ